MWLASVIPDSSLNCCQMCHTTNKLMRMDVLLAHMGTRTQHVWTYVEAITMLVCTRLSHKASCGIGQQLAVLQVLTRCECGSPPTEFQYKPNSIQHISYRRLQQSRTNPTEICRSPTEILQISYRHPTEILKNSCRVHERNPT